MTEQAAEEVRKADPSRTKVRSGCQDMKDLDPGPAERGQLYPITEFFHSLRCRALIHSVEQLHLCRRGVTEHS